MCKLQLKTRAHERELRKKKFLVFRLLQQRFQFHMCSKKNNFNYKTLSRWQIGDFTHNGLADGGRCWVVKGHQREWINLRLSESLTSLRVEVGGFEKKKIT